MILDAGYWMLDARCWMLVFFGYDLINDLYEVFNRKIQTFFPIGFAMKRQVNCVKGILVPGIFPKKFEAFCLFSIPMKANSSFGTRPKTVITDRRMAVW